jgi:mono/diheme cytochrome c family protein
VRRRVGATAWGIAVLVVLWPGVNGAQQQPAPAATSSEHSADAVTEGRSLFNQYCSHCHGPNAVQGERPRDLRRLTLRYGPRAPEVFWQTVSHGRPDKGMPVWKGTLSDDVLARIFSYLESVQSTP